MKLIKVIKKITKLGGSKFCSDYFIYSLEWTSEKLTWKINDMVVKTQTEGVPQDSMYIIISSGVETDIINGSLPVSLEVDWIKCYEMKE